MIASRSVGRWENELMTYRNCLMVFFLMLAAIWLIGCVVPEPTDAHAAVVLRQHQTVLMGQTVRVEFESNPSTGYSWSIDAAASTGLQHVTITGSGHTQASNPAGSVGSPGQQWWSIRGDSKGQVQLALIYHRAWEQGVKPARRAIVSIDVSR
jgi:inhibitor of cysteine peptidase